jgi:peptidoglycan hydrolase-like protein with peptidoglycan-binding domain
MIRRRSSTANDRQSRLLRRQRIVTAVAVACALAAIAGLIASRYVRSPQQAAAEASAPNPSIITAKVAHQVLATTLIFRGTVGSGSQIRITPQPSGGSGVSASIISALRVHVGQTVHQGQVLLAVSGRPLIALPGRVPAYRDLTPGDQGPDVRQLQRALASLGYFTARPNGNFGWATKNAISRLYQGIGYDVPTTGGPNDEGDRDALQAAQDAVTSAQRAVDDMKRQIAASNAVASSSPSPGEGTGAGGNTASSGEPLTLQLQYLQHSLDEAIANQQHLIATTGPEMPAAEVGYVPTFPARVTAIDGAVGSTVAAPLVTISTGNLVITDQMDPEQAKLLKIGTRAQVVAEVLGSTTTGTVTRIGATTLGSGGAYVPVTVTPNQRLTASWNGQDVRLTVTSAETSGPVLAVPVAAITTRSDGQTIVTRVDHGEVTQPVPVNTGVSANGLVQVTPTGGKLSAGDMVSVGR